MFRLGRVLPTFLFIAGVVCALSAAQNLPTVPQRDFQIWPDVTVSYDLTPKFTITAFEQLRFGGNGSRFAENLTSNSITYSPSRFVSVGSGYFYRYYNPYLTGAPHENRFYVQGTVRTPRLHGFVISDRLRSEMRWEEVADEINKKFILPGGHGKFVQRYRNRLTLQHPLRISQIPMTCFVRWERLYTLSQGWTQTRYYAGFDVPVTERVTLQNYYLYRSKTEAPQRVKQNVGISFIFDFHRRSEERAVRAEHPDE